MIRILHIISSLEFGGGVQMMLKNYYQCFDREQFRFDFVVHGSEKGALEDFFVGFGSKIYHVTPRRVSFFRNHTEIKEIIKNGNYDIVHNHQDYHGAYSLRIAKTYRIKGRICHTHITQLPKKPVYKIIKKFSVKSLLKNATHFFGCSEAAVNCFFGSYGNKIHYDIIKNAIDISRYRYSAEIRSNMRKSLGIDDEYVIGHVGRFEYVKNHDFIIDMFAEFKKRMPCTKLLLVGDGSLLDTIKLKAENLGLSDDVIFTGVRIDVPELLNAIDVMILPSFTEGLGMAVIEAQAVGLPCVCSKGVPSSTNLSGKVKYLPYDADKWCEALAGFHQYDRSETYDLLIKSGYDIHTEAEKLMGLYIETVKRD